MKSLKLLLLTVLLSSCWKFNNGYQPTPTPQRVWGNKPIYAARSVAEKISYISQKQPIQKAGNIYAFQHFIFQVDVGRGIHVINNSVPAAAERIGFIAINGCEQISVRGNFLYTNSYADLVTINISDPASIHEVNRVAGAFPEMMYNYPMVEPDEKGYYTCPQYDSVVVGWVKDSIYSSCYKN